MDGLTVTVLVAIGFCAAFAVVGKLAERKPAKQSIAPAE
jgi:hypothetical protein